MEVNKENCFYTSLKEVGEMFEANITAKMVVDEPVLQ
jgi:hypothetical protein